MSGKGHVTYFWNFGIPSISRDQLELETSNLACTLTTRKKCKIRSTRVGKGSRDLLLKFWDPFHISGSVGARNIKFVRQLEHWGTKEKNAKLGQGGREGVTWLTFEVFEPPPYLGNVWSYKLQIWQADWTLGYKRKKCQIKSKGVGKRSRDLLLTFWTPSISRGVLTKKHSKLGQWGSGRGYVTYFWNFGTPRGTVGARNFKFGMQIDHPGYQRKKCKIKSKLVGKGSRDLLLKFWDPSISRERLELETSNLARRLITRGTNKKNSKLGQRGREGVTWSTFEILGPRLYLGNGWSNKRQIWHADSSPGVLTKEMQN